MQRMKLTFGVLCCVILTAVLRADTAPDAIAIGGAVEKPGAWSVARIKSDLSSDLTTITYSGHDGKHTSTAVPLTSLLKAAGVSTSLAQQPKGVDPKAKHAEMHYAVVVQGTDGYFTVFSIAELMDDLANRKIWLALDVDGKSFTDAEAPMKLIVPDDEKPARWVHGVQSVSVVKVEPPATQPAK